LWFIVSRTKVTMLETVWRSAARFVAGHSGNLPLRVGFARARRRLVCKIASFAREADMPEKDAERVVTAAAQAMALTDGHPPSVHVLRHYVDDARDIVIGTLREMKRQGWDVNDLFSVLVPSEANDKRGRTRAPPRLPPLRSQSRVNS